MLNRYIASIIFINGILGEVLNAQGDNSNCKSGYFPAGSYQQSCWNCDIGNETNWSGTPYLKATCYTESNGENDSTLENYQSCSDIENQNGSLTCTSNSRSENLKRAIFKEV
jgi:hypothetical protein